MIILKQYIVSLSSKGLQSVVFCKHSCVFCHIDQCSFKAYPWLRLLSPSVSLQLVLLATSSLFPAPFPAQCVPLTAEPARRDPRCANVAAAFTGQPVMPTPLPARVSFVCVLLNLIPMDPQKTQFLSLTMREESELSPSFLTQCDEIYSTSRRKTC